MIIDIDVRYHQQDDVDYCGAANAMMLLRYLGVGMNSLDQRILYNQGKQNNQENIWKDFKGGLDPTGEKSVINMNKGSCSTVFTEYSDPMGPAVTQQIFTSIQSYNMPVPALVNDAAHWVLVKGFRNYKINKTMLEKMLELVENIRAGVKVKSMFFPLYYEGVYVNDPAPLIPGGDCDACAPPLPHGDADSCGMGITNLNTVPLCPDNRCDHGTADVFITLASWHSSWFTPFAVADGRMLCAAVMPEAVSHTFAKHVNKEVSFHRPINPKALNKIAECVVSELKKYGLYEDTKFADALENTQPAEPVAVTMLGSADDYYHLVPMMRGEDITAMVRMAKDGTLDSIMKLPTPVKRFFIDRSRALKKAQNIWDADGNLTGIQPLVDSNMAWLPCRESQSPFYPFYVVSLGKARYYVGMNGKVYSNLHDLRKMKKVEE